METREIRIREDYEAIVVLDNITQELVMRIPRARLTLRWSKESWDRLLEDVTSFSNGLTLESMLSTQDDDLDFSTFLD